MSCYYLFKLLSDLAVDFQQGSCLVRNLLNLYSGPLWLTRDIQLQLDY